MQNLLLGRPPTFGDTEQIKVLTYENEVYERKQKAKDQEPWWVEINRGRSTYVLVCPFCKEETDEDEYDISFKNLTERMDRDVYVCKHCGQRLKR